MNRSLATLVLAAAVLTPAQQPLPAASQPVRALRYRLLAVESAMGVFTGK